jgi:hypothetical protein
VAGALCLARARHPQFAREDILRQCPRLAEISPAACAARALESLSGALIANRS